VFWSRQGIFVTNLAVLLFMASLLTALRWWRTRQSPVLWLTAFLWGLGLYAKLLFAWAIGAMVIVAIVVWGARRWQIGKSTDPSLSEWFSAFRIPHSVFRTLLIAAGCFFLPLLPLLLFNLQTGGTVISIFGNLGQSYYGVNNRAYLPNLLTRLDQLHTLLKGNHLWYLGEVYANLLAPGLVVGLVLVWVIAWGRRRITGVTAVTRPRSLVALLPFALLGLIVAQSAFTVSDLFITHYALLVPLIPLGGGVIAGSLISHANRRSVSTMLIAALVCMGVVLWGGMDLANTIRYHRVLTLSGGYATHSDAIYSLADFLRRREPAAPLALDWGIDAPVRYLTGGRVNPVEVFGYERLDAPDAGYAGRLKPFLDNPDNLYVMHTGEFTIFRGRLEALTEFAIAGGKRLEEVARFSERSGRPLFLVYRVTPAAAGQAARRAP
jgi:hypothetical protein